MIPADVDILLVEDNPADARLVQLALAEAVTGKARTTHVERLAAALRLLEQKSYDAVLLDLSLPDSSGIDTVSQVIHAAPDTPIVVLSGLHDAELALSAVQGGAQDYLVKGQSNGEMIMRAVRYAMQRKQAETELRRARADLERKVGERTRDLTVSNERLRREIEQRHQAEAVLRKEHGFIAAVLDTVDALIVVLDRQGRIVGFNRACEATTGYAAAEVQDKPFWDIFLPPDEVGAVRATFEALRAGEFPNRFENHWLTRNGDKRLIAWSNTALLDEAGAVEYVIGTGIDITERRRAEDRERQRMLEIAHVARLSTMGEMATELAHELNQPLTAIAAYSDACARMVRSGTGRQEDLVEALESAAAQARRAGEIIKRLRGHVRKDDMRRIATDINELVRGVVPLAETEARWRGVGIRLLLADVLPAAAVDRILIEQVILNLVRNAIEALEGAEKDERTVTIQTSTNGNGAVIVAVRDTGPGLTPELAERVFAPFFSTKPQGMGMGLSISQSIAKAHGGRLWVTANQPRGAVFQFSIPTSSEAARDDAS